MDQFDNTVPWEKMIYVDMLAQKVKEENDKLALEQSARRSKNKAR